MHFVSELWSVCVLVIMSEIRPLCEGKIRESESWLLCSGCKYRDHISSCSAATDNSYKNESATAKKSWTCVTCNASIRDGHSAEVPNGAMEKKFASVLAQIYGNLTERP